MVFSRAWLDSAAPLSVVPLRVQNKGLTWQRLPGVQTTWLGQPCTVGHIDVWLPDQTTLSQHGPFSLLAKFPQSDPPGLSVPVLLGLEFLLTHHAGLNLPPPPQDGTIQIP
jgi:hypothetical protein